MPVFTCDHALTPDYVTKENIQAAYKEMQAFYGSYFDTLMKLDVRKSEYYSETLKRPVILVHTETSDVKSFKALGAANVVMHVVKDALKRKENGESISTVHIHASSEGNHAQGVAAAIREANRVLRDMGIKDLNVKGTIFMSTNADMIKVHRTEEQGTPRDTHGRIANGAESYVTVERIEGDSFDVADAACKQACLEKATEPKTLVANVPPFDNSLTIIGAATQAIPLTAFLKKHEPVSIVSGIAGGGLTCGMSRYFVAPNYSVIAAGTSAYPNPIVSLLNRGVPLRIRESNDDPCPIAVGGASVLEGGTLTGTIMYQDRVPVYTTDPEMLALALDEYIRHELGIKDGIIGYLDSMATGEDVPPIPEMAGLMAICAAKQLSPKEDNTPIVAFITGGNISPAKAVKDIFYAKLMQDLALPSTDQSTPFYNPDNIVDSLASIQTYTIRCNNQVKELLYGENNEVDMLFNHEGQPKKGFYTNASALYECMLTQMQETKHTSSTPAVDENVLQQLPSATNISHDSSHPKKAPLLPPEQLALVS